MAGMSFSFAARGNRAECIEQLNSVNQHGHSADGQFARGLLLAFMADAPQVPAVHYEITAYGHRDPSAAGIPSLNIVLTGHNVEADDPEVPEQRAEAAGF
jgi:hypothetical protein